MKRKASFRLWAIVLAISCLPFFSTLQRLWAADLEIALDSQLDQLGSQVETVQAFKHGDDEWTTFGIYDTGSSVASISYIDQFYFDLLGLNSIPVLAPNGASAEGIDGSLTGDVSQPGILSAGGLGAITIDPDTFDIGIGTSSTIDVPDVQCFLGTENGSPDLPTITGTPIHNLGMAAKIDMQGFKLDFGEGLVISLPDVNFVSSGTTLTGTTITPTPLRIPLQLVGENNYAAPGNNVSTAPNPVQTGVTLRQGLNPDETYAASITDQTFLFDTGAQISIVNTSLAQSLGVDLNSPIASLDVQGAAGNPIQVFCYIIDALELPRDDDGNGVIDGVLKLSNVP
ncbi:MAG: aspartyl protease family protein, partial [Thermoguttaceae bacterium]